MKLLVICLIVILGNIPLQAQSTQPTTKPSTTAAAATTNTTTPGSTVSPEEECAKHNSSCEDCLKHSQCFFCKKADSCKLYPKHDILPKSALCPLSEARWGVCWLNFEALIISLSVIGGVIIITITCFCIYCCCCRHGRFKKRYEREDSRYDQQKMERKVKQDERRSERKGRLDEIRRKYGLVKDDAPYQRFDA